jgi:hypothetical protein
MQRGGLEAARFHHASQRSGHLANCGAGPTISEAGDRVSRQYFA